MVVESHVLVCHYDPTILGLSYMFACISIFEPSDITGSGEPTDLRAVSRPIRASKGAGPLQDFLLCVSFESHVGEGSPAQPRPAKS